MIHRRRSVSPVDRMRIREIFIYPHSLIRTCGYNRQLDGGFVEDVVDQVACTRHSAHAIADDTCSVRVAGEGEGRSGLSGRTVIEAVVVELGAARSRKDQHYCSARQSDRYRSHRKNAERTWVHQPVIVHEAAVRLVIGEGISIGIWRGAAIDDVKDATVERVAGGVEGVSEGLV